MGGGRSRQNSVENTHLHIKQPGLLSLWAHLPVCSFYLTNLGNRQPYFFLLASPNGQPSVACEGIKSTLLPSVWEEEGSCGGNMVVVCTYTQIFFLCPVFQKQSVLISSTCVCVCVYTSVYIYISIDDLLEREFHS